MHGKLLSTASDHLCGDKSVIRKKSKPTVTFDLVKTEQSKSTPKPKCRTFTSAQMNEINKACLLANARKFAAKTIVNKKQEPSNKLSCDAIQDVG